MRTKQFRKTSHTPYTASELARTLFPVESINNIKITITRLRVIGDGCIWERISLMNALLSQSVNDPSSFKCLVVFLKEKV